MNFKRNWFENIMCIVGLGIGIAIATILWLIVIRILLTFQGVCA